MIFAFANPLGAAIQDTFAGDIQKMGQVGAQMGSAFGLGFALGPLVGSKLEGARAFVASSLAFASTSLFVALRFQETLPMEKRKEFDLLASNPLSFVQLFKTRAMATLTVSLGLQSMADYSNIYDFNFLFLKTVMAYGQEEVGRFAATFGFTQILGGRLAKQLIGSLGQATYTLLGNLGYIVGFALLGTTRSKQQLGLALLCLTLGHQRMGEPGNLLAEHAAATGMGNGEVQGAQANFMAVLKMIAPTLYGRLFEWATTQGRHVPGLPYFLICAFGALAQLLVASARQTPVPKKLA